MSTTDPYLILATDDFLPLDDPLRDKLESIAPIITFKARDGKAGEPGPPSWPTSSTGRTRWNHLSLTTTPGATRSPKGTATSWRSRPSPSSSPPPTNGGTYADTHFSTPILRDLGAHFREQRDDEINENGFPNWFSYEELGRLDNVDVIFTPVTDRAVLDKVEGNELWKRLPAVRNGLVFEYIPDSPTGSYGWSAPWRTSTRSTTCWAR